MRRLLVGALLAGAAFSTTPAQATCGNTIGDCVENTCNRLGCPVQRCYHWTDHDTCLY